MNNQRIPSVEPSTATDGNKKNFEILQRALGVVPNMTRAMAQSPAVLEGYIALNGALAKGTLDHPLREQLALALAGANHCDYCASAHTYLGQHAGLDESQITQAIAGRSTVAKTAAALRFARVLVDKRGQIDDADFRAATDAGFSPGQVGEIVAHVALNVFTNYFNHVAATAIDFPRVSVA